MTLLKILVSVSCGIDGTVLDSFARTVSKVNAALHYERIVTSFDKNPVCFDLDVY